MRSHWRIFVTAKTAEKALKLRPGLESRFGRAVEDRTAEPHVEGGHVISFSIRHRALRWSETVVEVLALAQRVGYGWILSGGIEDEVDACTKDAAVPGVIFIHWVYRNLHSE